jgi:hypothetical protein
MKLLGCRKIKRKTCAFVSINCRNEIFSRHFIFLCIQFFLNNSIQKEFKNKVEKSEFLISDQSTTDHDEAACLHSGGLFLPSPLTGPLPSALPPCRNKILK